MCNSLWRFVAGVQVIIKGEPGVEAKPMCSSAVFTTWASRQDECSVTFTPPDTIVTAVVVRNKAFRAGSDDITLCNKFHIICNKQVLLWDWNISETDKGNTNSLKRIKNKQNLESTTATNNIRTQDKVYTFKSNLKTYLFLIFHSFNNWCLRLKNVWMLLVLGSLPPRIITIHLLLFNKTQCQNKTGRKISMATVHRVCQWRRTMLKNLATDDKL